MLRSETSRITYVWLATCVLTIASAVVAATRGASQTANVGVSLAVLGIGAAKARLIMREFMEVRTAPPWLRLFTDVWLFGLLATIVVLYLQ